MKDRERKTSQNNNKKNICEQTASLIRLNNNYPAFWINKSGKNNWRAAEERHVCPPGGHSYKNVMSRENYELV